MICDQYLRKKIHILVKIILLFSIILFRFSHHKNFLFKMWWIKVLLIWESYILTITITRFYNFITSTKKHFAGCCAHFLEKSPAPWILCIRHRYCHSVLHSIQGHLAILVWFISQLVIGSAVDIYCSKKSEGWNYLL